MFALRDQCYDPALPRARVFDFFRPDTEEAVPLIVLIHGGGWISGEKLVYRDEALWLAQQGYAAACISYRLAPLNPFPAAVEDVQSFIRFARSGEHEFNIDPERIVAFGNSAGGHLACMAGLCETEIGTDKLAERPNSVVSLCGITDIRGYEKTHFPISFSFVEQFMGGPERDDPELYAQASPLTHVTETAPPFIIVHGTDDEVVPVDQSRALYSSLCSAGIPAQLHEFGGEGHSFTFEAWLRIRELTLELLDTL
ncbi:MAG: alpha/beta hydrolase [Armatimonadota bacterium]